METDSKTHRTSWQATKAAETRQRIIDSAIAIIAERGITSMTIDAVVQHSGITKGGLQYHFASKEALAFGVLQQATTTFLDGVRRACVGDANDPLIWSRALVAYAFADDPADIGHWKPLVEMLGNTGEVKALGESFFEEINRHLYAAGLSSGAALALMMALEGYSTSPGELQPGTGKLLRDHFLEIIEQANLRITEKAKE